MAEELRGLERKSDEWYRKNRHRGYYFHECPGWLDEHNRQCKMDRLRGVKPQVRRLPGYNGEEL